jgi:tRNA pseudouridine synthase 10
MRDGRRGIVSHLIIDEALALLEEVALCDHCLGRQFAMLGHGLDDTDRGRAVKNTLLVASHNLLKEGQDRGVEGLMALARNGFNEAARSTLASEGLEPGETAVSCYLCEGSFTKLDELVEQCLLRLSSYEYGSFLVGIHAPPSVVNREDELRARHKLRWGESIRGEFSREIGKRIQQSTGKDVDLKRPDILVMVNPFAGEVSLKINSIYIAGRYRKLVRGIPQSRWMCGRCGGKGCDLCGGTGKLYQESVEELIGGPAASAAAGSDFTLHAAGREDIDVRALGSGRPFVLEIHNPVKRSLDLELLASDVNESANSKVEVEGLRPSSRLEVRSLKNESQTSKTYRALVEFDGDVSDAALPKLEQELNGQLVEQFTPTRVAHRRANLVRKKYIYDLGAKRVQSNSVELVLRCQGGLYIKELITGDGGRTRPSVGEIVGIPAKCLELDVLNVEKGDVTQWLGLKGSGGRAKEC